MHVLIFGLGVSGKAALAFCEKRGDQISIFDDKLSRTSFSLKDIDLVIKSPGIPFTHPIAIEAKKRDIPILGEIDLALQELKRKTLYAITGSNGKTTTTLLTAHLLNTAGKKAVAVGNVGIPFLSQINAEADYFVVELSSFQLESIQTFPAFDAAVLLNLTPNHLDRHQTFEAYAAAKFRLRECLKKEAPFYVSQAIADYFHLADPIFDLETILDPSYKVSWKLYSHDVQNIAAALVLSGVDDAILKKGWETFKKPPHRIEFVREYEGITFINDSKATSVDAVAKAVEAIPMPIVLIAGGVDKGGTYRTWLPLFRQKVRKVLAIGEAARRIDKELSPDIVVEPSVSLEEAVKKSAQCAKKGETVLLSPGCSSYDQFKNYEHRGEKFKEIVYALEELLS